MKREAAVDYHVLLRIQRIGKDEDRRVIGIVLFRANADAVSPPPDWQAIGNFPVNGIARRIAKQRKIIVDDVVSGNFRIVLHARLAAKKVNPFRNGVVGLLFRPCANRLGQWSSGWLHENEAFHERVIYRTLKAVRLAQATG